MPSTTREFLKFGPFKMDVEDRQLFENGQLRPLSIQDAAVLLTLLRNAGRIVSKNDLLNQVWGETHVDERSVKNAIKNIRRALGDTPQDSKFIETHAKRGYRWIGGVESYFEEVREAPYGRNRTARKVLRASADPHDPPWVGPEAYNVDQADYFFGRGGDLAKLAGFLDSKQKRVVFLYSPSGAGKSSLINAGLRPHFKKQKDFDLLTTVRFGLASTSDLLPGQNPFTHAVISSTREHDGFPVPNKPLTLTQYLSTQKHRKPNRVLIIDQAEELMTAHSDRGPQIKPFFIEVKEALIEDPGLRVLFAFREEYLGRFQRLGKEISDLSIEFLLANLDIEQARLAVQEPALSHSVNFDPPGLVTRLLQALSDYTGEYVEPMHLQLTCIELWKALDHGANKISWEVFNDAILRLRDSNAEPVPEDRAPYFVKLVLYGFCQRAIEKAVQYAHAACGVRFPAELIELACVQFVKEGRRHAPIPRGKQWTGDIPNEIIDGLVKEQLLRVESLHDQPLYELTHDALIQPVLERAELIDDHRLMAVISGAVREIAESDIARSEGVVPKSIIQKICLLFISPDGTRLQVSHESLKSEWLLREWVVSQMVLRGLLRRDIEETAETYQLSHWRLAHVLHRHHSTLLAEHRIFGTQRLLGTYLEQCRTGTSEDLWFRKTGPLLKEVNENFDISDFSDLVAEFVLCSNLALEEPLDSFLPRLSKTHRELTANVLRRALRYKEPLVRRNAVAALSQFPLQDRDDLLRDRALNDIDESVRELAATVLANLENYETPEPLIDLLVETPGNRAAVKVLAWMHDAMPSDRLRSFHQQVKRLPWSVRFDLRIALTTLRFARDKSELLVAWLVGAAATYLFIVPTRAVMASFNLTITQLKSSFWEGLFNGFAGATTWGFLIGGAMLLWWYLVEGRRPWRSRASIWIAGLAGLVGGIINTIAMVNLYIPSSLAKMQWIPREEAPLIETLTVSHLALAMPLYGCFVGLGVAVTTLKLLPWSASVELPVRQSEHSRPFRIFNNTTLVVLKNSWLILLPTISVAILVRSILPEPVFESIGRAKLFGEGVSVSIGGIGLVVGILYRQIILRTHSTNT